MILPKIITQLQKPLQKKRKLFALVLILVVLLGGIGAAYFFHLESERERLVQYKTQQLDDYFQKLKRKLENDQLIINATGKDSENDTIKKEADCNFINNRSRECLDRFVEKQLNFERDFNEYILEIKNVNYQDSISYSSSFNGLSEKQFIDMFKKDTLWFSKKREVTLNHQNYLVLGKSFSYNTKLNNRFEISIFGLVTKKSFRQQVGQLDPAVVAFLITILLILVTGLPFFKMIFISEDERLFSYDVIFAGLSTILGAPLILILLLSTQQYFRDYDAKIIELEHIAERLKVNFEDENLNIVEAMANFDFDHYRKKKSEDFFFQAEDNSNFDTKNIKYFKYVSEVFASKVEGKAEEAGEVNYHINYFAKPPDNKAPRNLGSRTYFKDLKEGKNIWNESFFSPKDSNKIDQDYVMRPVVSIESNSEEAVYAINLKLKNETESPRIGVFSVQLKSLHSTSLPIGYNFAVIDESGEVWFHSTPGKSTLENLFLSSNNDETLEAAVKGRVESWGDFTYHGERQIYATLPIESTNLSVVTFYDLEMIGLQISEVLSITTIFFLCLAFFMAIVVLVSVFLKNPKWGLFKFYKFPFQFLLPKKEHRKAYHFLTLVFAILFIVLACIPIKHYYYSFNYMLGFVVIYWSYLLCFYVLRSNIEQNKLNLTDFSFIITSILLSILIINYFDHWIPLLQLELIFITLIGFSFTKWFRVNIYSEKNLNPESKDINKKDNKFSIEDKVKGIVVKKRNINYKYSYVNFLALLLFSSTLLPSFLFFENSKLLNETIWQRANLFEYLSHHREKEQQLKNEIFIPIDFSKNNDGKLKIDSLKKDYNKAYVMLLKSHQTMGNYYPKLDNNSADKKYPYYRDLLKDEFITNDSLNTLTIFDKLIWRVRPIYKPKARKYQHFGQMVANDKSWESQSIGDSLQFRLNSKYDNNTSTAEYIGNRENKNFINFIFGSRFWHTILLLLIVVFGTFYWLILFYVDRCFAFRFFYLNPSEIDQSVSNGKPYAQRLKKIISSSKGNSGLYIIGLPSTGKQTFAEKILKGELYLIISCSLLSSCSKDEPIEIILSKICVSDKSEGQNKDVPYYILQNFENNLLSFDENHLKLKLISYLLANQKKLIITSEIYPNQLTDVYRDQVEQSGELKSEIAVDFNSWRDILGGFHQILLGITKQDEMVVEATKDFDFKAYEVNPLDMLKDEFGYSKYLPSLSPIILSKCTYEKTRNDNKIVLMLDEQRMVQNMMFTAHGYYTNIWSSLPRREKYILFDIAKDGFMNIKNSNSLFSLMKKGLIVWDDIPRVFNRSFRNFVMAVGMKDIQLSDERRQTGGQNWGTMKIIIIVIIIAIIAFIIIGNPGLVKDLESFYGALAGIGALIPILSSLLGKRGQSN